MADIHGPYLENQPLDSVEMVTATESDPVVIVCRYICYDRVYQRYNFELSVDVLDPCAQRLRRKFIRGTQEYQDSRYNFRVVPITNGAQTCDQRNDETIRKYRIHVGSSDTPILIANCFVKHSPNSPSTVNSTECSNSSTLAIVHPDSFTCIAPSKTVLSSSISSSLLSTINSKSTETVTFTVSGGTGGAIINNDLQHIVCGSLFATLAVIMLILFIVLFVVVLACKSFPKKCQCTQKATNSEHESEQNTVGTASISRIRMAWLSSDNNSGSQFRPRTA